MIIYNRADNDYYSPNIFIRAGLLILTFVIAVSVTGLLSLLLGSLFLSSSFYVLFLGISSYIALELSVRKFNHYRSGVDDALLWISSGLILGGLIMLTDNLIKGNEEQVTSGLILLLSFYLTLRFADISMAAVCYSSLIAFIFFSWQRIPVWGMATMPFLIMVVAGTSYYVASRYYKKTEQPAYLFCLTIVVLFTLIVFYASGNYFIVQTLNPAAKTVTDAYGVSVKRISFAFFFWCWTVLVPLIYVGFGLIRKDVILIRMGLLLIAAAIFTIRYYYHIVDIEWALTIGGLVLIGIAYALHKYLKVPRYGFTADELSSNNILAKQIAESMAISATANTTTHLPADNRFGGGSFGGGGASSNF